VVTVRRLVLTATAMAVVAAALRLLTGPLTSVLGTLTSAVTVSATAGPDDVVVAAVGLLAWAIWAWGAIGLLLTAASAAPGAAGSLARGLARLVLPASLRTASGLALGVGLLVAAPPAVAAPAAHHAAVAVPDWPVTDPSPAPPDWPSATPSPAEYVVVPGDCLWRIAAGRLLEDGPHPSNARVADAVDRWWTTNADVIGPDPDLIRPGQVLLPPPGTATPTTEHPFRSNR
jgi:hypothetical protein